MRKIKMGMVGGGRDAFIGAVHRMAAALDGQIDLACGAFSSNAEKSKLSGQDFYLPENRVYGSYTEMIETEKKLPFGERMDFVSIVTPNNMHFPPAKMALENGFHVVCDKPLCLTIPEAEDLVKLVNETQLHFALTHNYTGYPMVKQARAMVASGALGKIRKIHVGYPQGWLSKFEEGSGQKQAAWRTDPTKSGVGGALGDIATHAENLAGYISGLKITKLYAQLNTFVEGRLLDDDTNIFLEYSNGAKGILFASQICAGEENGLHIKIYGELGGLEWTQTEPNTLIHRALGETAKMYRTGVGTLSSAAQKNTRMFMGHPEGYIEAFANIYKNFAYALQASWGFKTPDSDLDYPGVEDGLHGMKFVYAVVDSNKKNAWVEF